MGWRESLEERRVTKQQEIAALDEEIAILQTQMNGHKKRSKVEKTHPEDTGEPVSTMTESNQVENDSFEIPADDGDIV